ncbi:hypothetical protein OCU04_008847 [Sclerotinia nivalis]|uniref:Uncharacterized protein n=1 Tax=Sclerotinia nivalis TaxID=352851 RepID=A0A9X0AGA8_9HELO|nr:hypothetical protein OCU04_008847 [Sclerotinia nivalis]
MRRTQPEQTENEDYESIRYKTFAAVDYDRYMSWEAGPDGQVEGRISIGQNFEISRIFGTKVKEEKKSLPKGWFVIVMDAKFKLVAAKP